MQIKQNDLERIKDKLFLGELTLAQANVQMIRCERVRLVVGGIPIAVRRALNAAVKAGELGHMRKDGHKPEAYYHPTFEWMARGERLRCERETKEASAKFFGLKGENHA